MITKKYKGVWFYGSRRFRKNSCKSIFKKKIKNSLVLDGDKIRKYVSFDLGYTIKERKNPN